MILSSVPQVASSLLAHVLEPAARSLALGCFVALAFALSRARSVSLRLHVWKAVLCVALAMPLLGAVLPELSWNVPSAAVRRAAQLLPQPKSPTAAPSSSADLATEILQAPVSVSRNSRLRFQASRGLGAVSAQRTPTAERIISAVSPAQAAPAADWNLSTIPWMFIASAVYISVALIFLASVAVGLFFGRRLDRASWPIHDTRATTLLSLRACVAGVQKLPRLAESELLSVPVTFGVLRPSILLPAGWREWGAAELDAVISHEISHVARRDALTERLSLLHRALFWFSPLSWWLHRELAELAEEASDDAALAAGADRTRYAETLLGFFADIEAAPGRAWWQGVAMATAGQAEKRVDRILGWKGSVTMQMKKSVVAALVLSAVPVVCLTAAFRPRIENINSTPSQSAQEQAPPAATPAPPSPAPSPATAPSPAPTPALAPHVSVSVAPVATVSAVTHVMPVVTVAPVVSVRTVVTQAPRAGAIAPRALGQPQSDGSSRSNTNMSWSGNDQEFVIVSGNSYVSVSHDSESYGSGDPPEFVVYLKEKVPGDFIWFHRDGKSYFIREQANIARAKQLFAPAMALSVKQEALGKQQEALGEKQEALGKQQEQVHIQIPDMTAELRALESELKALSASGGTQEDLGRMQEKMGDLQNKLGDLQSKAGEEQGRLGEQQGKLGEEQGKLGEEQGRLGEEEEKISREASRQMKSVIDDAIAKGLAQPE